jgi:tetratricopeptide (TPR) repeat protein
LYVAERLAAALNDFHRLGQILSMQTISFTHLGDHERSLASSQRVLTLAKAHGDINLEVLTNLTLGGTYRLMGNYSQAIGINRKVIDALEGERRYEHFNRLVLPSISARYYLAGSLAECGIFIEGEIVGKEAVAIAETAGHAITRVGACYALGHLYLRQGVIQKAVSLFEQGVEFSQGSPFFFSFSITLLGAAYALAGRINDALVLLEQTGEQGVEQATAAGQGDPGLALVNLSHIALSAGHWADAQNRAERCLIYSQSHSEKGNEAWSSWLLGEIAIQREAFNLAQAATHYQQALILANELGMRPLHAHCRRGLGKLYSQTGQAEQARTELTTAIEMYRDMEMTFWLPETEAALAEVEGR